MTSSLRRTVVVDPSPPGVRGGNRVTALRWARVLRGLGWQARVRGHWAGEPCELLVVLHALKGAASARAWRAERGAAPLVVALTGTDFEDDEDRDAAFATLRLADAVVTLYEGAAVGLAERLRAPVYAIPQAFTGCVTPPPGTADGVVLALLANLRAVKDPLLGARALALLPEVGNVRLDVVGGVLEPAAGAAMQRACAADPRVRWLGPLRRRAALGVLQRSHALLLTSRHEGGAGVVGEALALGRGVLSTDLPAVRALLGDEHPGLFPVGDATALAALVERVATQPAFRERLTSASLARAPLVDPALERERWRALLAALTLRDGGDALL